MKKCPQVCAKQNATIELSYTFELWYYIETKENQFPNIHKDKIQEKWKKKDTCTKILTVALFSNTVKELETA